MIKKITFVVILLSLNLVHSTIVLINGTTCSGKSSTVNELMRQHEKQGLQAFSTSIDDTYKIAASDEFTRQVNKNLKFISFNEWDPFSMGFALWHEEIFRLQKNNPNATILVDHFLSRPMHFANILHVWDKNNRPDLLFVKLFCAQQVAENRLKQRNSSSDESQHRHPTIVKSHFHPATIARVHENKHYDLELNTQTLPPESCAQQIITRLKGTEPLNGFLQTFNSNNNPTQQNLNRNYDHVIGDLAARMRAAYDKKDSAELWKIQATTPR